MPRSAAPAIPVTLPAAEEEATPAQDGWRRGDLGALRAELDRIDDAVHDLLMDRARVVEQVARSGKPAALRPGREAAIIRRLLKRHEGQLPPQAIFRMWRELLAGTTAMQGVFSVAVHEPGGDAAFTQLAREHFGTLTPLRANASADQVLAEVRQGDAAVGVLPMPRADAPNDWWVGLLKDRTRSLYVVARLPFWSIRTEGAPAVEALVVAAALPDASGKDRTLLGLKIGTPLMPDGAVPELANVGFRPGLLAVHPGRQTMLAEVEGFVGEGDPRLRRLGWIVLGSYAVPIGGEGA